MSKNKKIIDALNLLMKHELTAIDVYFLHSRFFKNLGLSKVFEKLEGERVDEVDHVKLIIDRILFLGGIPDFSKRINFTPQARITDIFKEELDFEYAVGVDLKAAVQICENEQDYGTRNMLMTLLNDSEQDHIYWLERQLSLISQIGESNYILSMV